MNLLIRLATSNDALLYFNWANEVFTRKNSFNSEPIKYEIHKKWFIEKLKDPNTLLFIFENDTKTPIGQIRIEHKTNENSIGISIDSDFRGKGLAKKMIEKACNLFFDKFFQENEIVAYIKNENQASINSFFKAGFLLFQKIDEIQSLKLVKRRDH